MLRLIKMVVCITAMFVAPFELYGGYTRQCQYSASDLESAARKYENEKSSYESACGDFGYSRNDEGACGSYGYVTSSYKSAADRLKRAIQDTYDSCGVQNDGLMYIKALKKSEKEIRDLRTRLAEMEQELERARNPAREDLPPASQLSPETP